MWGHRVSVVENGLESGLTFAEPASLLVTENSLFVLPVETILMPGTLPGKAFHSSLPKHILSILQDPAQFFLLPQPTRWLPLLNAWPLIMSITNTATTYTASAMHYTAVLAI